MVPPIALREKDLNALRDTFHRFSCIDEVHLFGSRATGSARRASDVDLAISAPNASAQQWSEIIEAIEEAPVIYEFDIVRTERAHNLRLINKISSEGVSIYSKRRKLSL